jgi:hypothetical protein
MNTKKSAGIALMVAFAAAFIAWSMMAPPAMPSMARSIVSGALALGIFLAWRVLVWEKPGRKF